MATKSMRSTGEAQMALPIQPERPRGEDQADDGGIPWTAEPFLPDGQTSLPALRDASKACRGCDLYERGTQTVFGEGTDQAEVMLVGEQPGDSEDRQGRPFVGPAGQLLDRALVEAGIDRQKVYVTNAVKHFKWEPRGKRRIHQKPNAREIQACKPWLEAEISSVRPRVIVALGATAAQALFGSQFRVSRQRGQLISSPLAPSALATVHPSSILRAPDDETRELEMELFIQDLQRVAPLLEE
ncbi:MAG TPA: UdgX family uracil-DNA binding protein [Chloroflexota bacterium]|nr:UdgX family uracil-DNA binding protein [Chloroflexota bacterium]